jgi:hypothetical protein
MEPVLQSISGLVSELASTVHTYIHTCIHTWSYVCREILLLWFFDKIPNSSAEFPSFKNVLVIECFKSTISPSEQF